MITGLFVTGTDTGVGKTVVCAALLSRLHSAGIDAVPMKPVQTGCERCGNSLVATDLEFVLTAAGLRPPPEEREWMSPYRFEPDCSPHLAAARAGEVISIDHIASCFHELAVRHDMVIVEGAGGVLVPLGPVQLVLDLMVRLKLQVILVSRPGLGTINHTLLSLREIRRAGLNPLGVVLNATSSSPGSFIEEDNRRTLARLAAPIGMWSLPFSADVGQKPMSEIICKTEWASQMPTARDILDLNDGK